MALKIAKRELMILALVGVAAAGWGQVVRPTGDLIVVQRENAQVGDSAKTVARDAVIAGLRPQVRQSLAEGRILVVRPPKEKSWQEYRQALLQTGLFSSVEPDTIVSPCAVPNDPEFGQQWHLGQISAPRAWDFNTGVISGLGSSIVVAVVDGGIDLNHPDLVPNLVPGYNTLSGLTQLAGGDVSDVRTNGHGTRIAGIIGARGNNGIGVAGIGWDLKVMPIRATNDAANGNTSRSELLEGVQWALDNGARVVSVSYTGVENADVQAMGAYARTLKGHLVWAAGNTNTDWSSFDWPDVTVVGGTNQSDGRWTSSSQVGSSFGRAVDIYAPCIQIRTTSRGGGYGNAPAGTSFAAPQVAASLALLCAMNPTANSDVIEYRLLRASRDLGIPGADTTWGWGRLNVGKALSPLDLRYDFQLFPRIFNGGVGWNEEATQINDNAQIVSEGRIGIGSARSFAWYQGTVIQEAPNFSQVPGGWNSSDYGFTGLSNTGLLVGFRNGAGTANQGLVYRLGTGWLQQPRPTGWPMGFVSGVSANGHLVGYDFDFSGNVRGWVQLSGQDAWVPINTGPNIITAINNSGQYVGSLGPNSTTPFVFDGQLQTSLPSTFYSRSNPLVITNRGDVFANESDGGNGSVPVIHRFPYGPAHYRQIGPLGSLIYDVNDNGVAVGKDSVTNRAMIFEDFLNSGTFLDQRLSAPLPNTVQRVESARSINNLGVIVGGVRLTDGLLAAYRATPIATPAAMIDLGQLGESPTYIGSIPPVLSVTFTDSLGIPYPNATVNLTYSGVTGRLDIAVPPSVTGQYRLFMRCNSIDVPGYSGPNFLSRLYPPIGLPAAPPDVALLPFAGEINPQSGLPTLELYPGDMDNSGEIDLTDIDITIANYGRVNGDPGWDPATDVDGSGEIDLTDIDIVIANYGLAGDPEP